MTNDIRGFQGCDAKTTLLANECTGPRGFVLTHSGLGRRAALSATAAVGGGKLMQRAGPPVLKVLTCTVPPLAAFRHGTDSARGRPDRFGVARSRVCVARLCSQLHVSAQHPQAPQHNLVLQLLFGCSRAVLHDILHNCTSARPGFRQASSTKHIY